MAALTRDAIRKLAESRDGSGVVSLYLDVDGRRYVRPKDYEFHLEKLLREARDTLGADPADIQRLQERLADIDRSHTRGVALFSSVADDLFEAFELSVPVRNHIAVNASPHVRQLEAIVERYEPIAVLLVDRERFRMMLFHLGELVDRTEFSDPLPRHEDDKGDWDRDHVKDHVDEAAHRHVRRAAQRAFEVYQEHPFEHLVVAAPDEIANEVEHDLHSYLRDRLAGRIHLPTTARDADIRAAVMAFEESLEVERETREVERLRSAVGAGSGVAGLDAVLGAISQRRVEMLLVSEGYEAPGWHCPGCSHLATVGRSCAQCGTEMDALDDAVEAAVEEALMQSCSVLVCGSSADLDVMGRIGATLRF